MTSSGLRAITNGTIFLKQTDEVGEVERLSADVAQAESSLAELKNS